MNLEKTLPSTQNIYEAVSKFYKRALVASSKLQFAMQERQMGDLPIRRANQTENEQEIKE